MEGTEIALAFGAVMALIKIIEKLVDSKMGKNQRPVQVDLHQTEIANQMGQMTECLAATGQTLERINDKIDEVHTKSIKIETLTENINRVVIEAGSNVFGIKKELENKARDRLAEERGAARERAKIGES